MTTNFLLPGWDLIGIAWKKVSGSKGTFWAAIGIMILVLLGFAILSAITKNVPVLGACISILGQWVNYLLQMGMLYIGIQRAYELPITFRQMFRSLQSPYILNLTLMYLLEIVLFLIPILIIIAGVALQSNNQALLGALCYIIGGIAIFIIAVRVMLAPGFVLDKGLGPWEAIKQSFKATHSNFWRLVGVGIFEMIVLTVAIIPLGIGLIWVLPFLYILYGEIYKSLMVNTTIA